MIQPAKSARPYWSLEGLVLGARLVAPLVPATIAFGIAVGSATAAKGFALVEHLLFNIFVFAGLSQMVALEVWPDDMTGGAIAGLALVVAIVNARMLLFGAGLRGWLDPLPAWQVYPTLHLLTDPGWLVAMRYRAEGGADAAVVLGSGLLFFFSWFAATTAGYFAGSLVPDARAIALDLVMPIFFVAMLVPLWRGTARAIPWIVAGAVALLVHQLIGGWWYVLAGSLAGIVAGGFVDDAE